MELQGRVEELRAKGLGLAAISYDSPEILAAFSKARGITFPLLSDAGSATIKAFGILNTVAAEAVGANPDDAALVADIRKYVSGSGGNAGMVGMAFPGTFMIDRQGRVTARFFESFYAERNTASAIMVRLGAGGTPVAATRVSTDHLEVTTYPTEPAIAPGNRFALAFDIVPRPGIHVYAPGASGYRVIALTLDAPAFVRTLPVAYPKSEMYVFEPLNERVPVYQRPFTLVQELILDGDAKAQAAYRERTSVTLNGRLDYQACDDKLCFNPVSVPLSWTLALQPLVRDRPARPQ